ncbi:MAG: putative protein N(5)-glutamine methyltransferase [Pseudarthrobacter sp.]|nr:putative protein N(5)-glutamine methyltransferase [Pseudarthrobacter sp.]
MTLGVPTGSPKGVPMPIPEPGSESVAFPAIVLALRTAGCVFAEDEARLLLAEASSAGELSGWVKRRVAGVPLEHILGWAEFCGLRIAVDPGVFVPRRRTGLLVAEAVKLLRHGTPATMQAEAAVAVTAPAISAAPPVAPTVPQVPSAAATLQRGVVLDLCCGSGAVGAAIASQVPDLELHAADIDPVAVNCARRNVKQAGGGVHQGDLYAALPRTLRGRVRLLAVNAPYVPTEALATMPLEARNYEPRVSLDGGPDGLDLHRRVITETAEWLAPGAHLLIETSERQAAGTAAIMAAAGFDARIVHSSDLDGTVVIGRAQWGSASRVASRRRRH